VTISAPMTIAPNPARQAKAPRELGSSGNSSRGGRHRPVTARPCPGGSNNTRTYREPQRGQRSLSARRFTGKSRPRVQTKLSMSSSYRYVHSRLDRDCGPSVRPPEQRTSTRHCAANASSSVAIVMRTKIERCLFRSRGTCGELGSMEPRFQ
jgi:hypothetical protein